MLEGHRTWVFDNHPVIISTGTVGGPFEAGGNVPEAFDILHDDMWLKQSSFEKAQRIMMEEASQTAVKNSLIQKEHVNFFISGDLINQITPSNFAAKTLDVPYLGLFSACATSMESLALAAFIINGDGADYILSGTASHNAATEKQFRYPTEYGGQKPPTAQWTVTGAGCALVAKNGEGPIVTSATIGKVVDMGMSDPFNMGAAMAPAAVDTIETHLRERDIDPSYYDLIITGDLGHVGREISLDMLREKNIPIQEESYQDCGLTIYREGQPVLSGASGTASSAVGVYGHFLKLMKDEQLSRILVVATGSLHSPLSVQQNDAIPCIAHAVSIESGSDSQ
ncbi:stage V sporulation protein AD [Lentibacillus amyloliquefaciens]|uniref:Stage V sporulation protein AD n=1 Tax=Lentibacillus amyloliquefaciens TaxID=1472767 RepID=A0A0U4EVB9_9BACI|nr:stage V sporulation protein AD [Lentibacillus amyloliquefaciens]ALX47303.1 stage V sporulation protein AD [Lentibacillus amyloliquefaciens]